MFLVREGQKITPSYQWIQLQTENKRKVKKEKKKRTRPGQRWATGYKYLRDDKVDSHATELFVTPECEAEQGFLIDCTGAAKHPKKHCFLSL